MKDGLTQQQRKALRSMMSEKTLTSAAKQARVNERTLRRWLAEDENFKQAVQKASDDLMVELRATLTAAASDAVAYLSSVISSPDEPSTIRVSAAKALLNHAMPQKNATQAVLVQNGATQEQLEEARDSLLSKLLGTPAKDAVLDV
jgi:hypothetical protein